MIEDKWAAFSEEELREIAAATYNRHEDRSLPGNIRNRAGYLSVDASRELRRRQSIPGSSVRPVSDDDVRLVQNSEFEYAMRAFHNGPPGIVRMMSNRCDNPPRYSPVTTSATDERQAIADAINAYLGAGEQS